MVTDPATSPSDRRGQVVFGLAVAAAYAALVLMHVVFRAVFGLTLVCVIRGLGVYALRALAERRLAEATVETAVAVGEV